MNAPQRLVLVLVIALAISMVGCQAAETNQPAGSLAPPEESSGAGESPGAPSSAPSVASGGYSVGDRVQLGDEEYFGVVEVDLAVDTTGMTFQPDAGNKFIAALVEIEGINPDGAAYNPFFFTLRDEQGFEYNYSAFGKEPTLQSSNDLAPGDTVRGWVNFEVPQTANTFLLIYAPGFFNEPVQVSLN